MLNRLFALLFLFAASNAYAELPLSFTQNPPVNNMALGQSQNLQFVVQNNLQGITLPLKNINVINDGDNQPSNATAFTTSCGATLPPGGTCSVDVTIANITPGVLKRHLAIDYNGRAPLVAPLDISISKASYTVLVYIVGSNLESDDDAGTDNIDQMAQAGSSQNLNIVIETGGSVKPGWTTVQRKVVYHGFTTLIKDLGALNMGLTSTIEDFIQWGVTNYPAEKYILVFWDHGGGPVGGYGGDDNFGGAGTSISQLKNAVSQAVTATGASFEIIGFDTCLLGNSETVAGLYPYTHYFVGSEDSEPAGGWQYNTFLGLINSQPNSNGEKIGTEIINGYTQQNAGSDTTLSLIDATQMLALTTALSNFSNALSPHTTNVTDWKILARARVKSPDFDTSVWSRYVNDLVDFTQFVKMATAAFPADAAVQQAGTALLTTSQNAILYYQNSPSRKDAMGLTMYFPSILAKYQSSYPASVTLNGAVFFPQDYLNLLNSYVNFYSSNTSSLLAVPSMLNFDGTNYTAQISNDYDTLYATAGNDSCTNVFTSDGTQLNVPCYTAMQFTNIQSTPMVASIVSNISYNKADNEASWPMINGQPALLIPEDFNMVENNNSTYIIPVHPVGSETPGYLDVVLSNGEYIVVGYQEGTGSSLSQTKMTPIANGTQFYLRTYALNTTWNLYRTSTQIQAPFEITMGTLPAGYNAFRFMVGDLTGALNVTSSSVAY